MIPIHNNWKQYFINHHEGIGTTYERFILHRYFEKIQRNYSIQSILEVPSFGMTGISGINSLWWALNKGRISIVDHSIERIDLIRKVWNDLFFDANFVHNSNGFTDLFFKDKEFDLSWNFAALWFIPKLEEFFHELTRVTQKVIFICVPNGMNVFNSFRMMTYKNADIIYDRNIDPTNIKNMMLKQKWIVKEQGFLDIPPWPDIAMTKEDLLFKIGLSRLAKKLNKKKGHDICILDYFNGKNKEMEKEILKFAFLEGIPTIFKRFWAHHQYFIFTPSSG